MTAARKRSPTQPIRVVCSLFNGIRPVVSKAEECTWQAFASDALPALLAECRREKTDLPSFVLAPVEGRRNEANVGAHTALVIDVDALPENDLGALLKRASRYRAIVYETPSSTDEAPRVRVVAALAAPIEPGAVPGARRALAEALGLDPDRCGTSGALPASQVMFCGLVRGTRARGLWTYEGALWCPPAVVSEPPRRERRALAVAPRVPRAVPAGAFPFDSTPDLTSIAKYVPPAGQDGDRHSLVRALGGWLARRGYAVHAIAEAVASQIPSSDPTERAAQAAAVAQRVRADLDAPAPGWEALGVWAQTYAKGLSTLRRLEHACRDPREPIGFDGVWSEWWAQVWPKWEARADRWSTRVANDVDQGTYAEQSQRETVGDAEVDNIIASLAPPKVGVFQRSGKLTIVTREACVAGDVVRPGGTPTIRVLPLARLRELIRETTGRHSVTLAGEVMARGEWSHIRPLDAIVSYPVMRRDGTLLLESGYDAATRTLAEMTVRVNVPDEPTQLDARKAVARLDTLVSDFPFTDDAQKSAWFAMLLTVPARPAIDGPTPLGLLEASQRSSGKSLLADLIALVATGETAPRCVAPKTKEEWDKSLFTILLAGDPLVLFDNITNMLVSDALDAVLTGTTFQQRMLGENERQRIAIRTVFLASANNARLSTDLVRRSLGCRLEPKEERPEARTGFRIPDLLGYTKANRAALLGAALTILRAYAVARRPRVDARPMGSYDAWCRVVRDALVWAGAADPAVTQDALRENADVERDELRELLAAWNNALGDKVVTAKELIDAHGIDVSKRDALAEALRGVTPNGADPTTRTLGNKLRALRGDIVGGLVLKLAGTAHGGAARWQVRRV